MSSTMSNSAVRYSRQTASPGIKTIFSLAVSISALALTSCATLERESKLQCWEKCRIASERALKKHQPKLALQLAQESASAADGFGDADFRRGISLCLLGTAQKANKQNREAESSYKQSLKVLNRAEKAALDKVSADRANNIQTLDVAPRLVVEDLAASLTCLGDLYNSMENYSDAVKCFQKASERYNDIITKYSMGLAAQDLVLEQEYMQSLLALGRAAVKSNNLELAENTYRSILKIAAGSTCSEYQRREVRDELLTLLQKEGRQNEAGSLVSDALFNQYTADGMLALSEGDFTAAEMSYRKAMDEAVKSVYSKQRTLRSLLNLISVFVRQNKPEEVLRCRIMVDRFVLRNPQLTSMQEYDQIQDMLANYYFIAKNIPQTKLALEKALVYRLRVYGPDTKEVAAIYARLGAAEFYDNNLANAQRYEDEAYKIVEKHRLDRTYFTAMTKTVELTAILRHFERTEELQKRLIEIKESRYDKSDPWVISLKANLILFYNQFNKKDNAALAVKGIVADLEKAKPDQRINCFPYLIVILTCCINSGWYDIAKPVAQLGQSILSKDLGNVFPNEMIKNSWNQALERLQKHPAT